MKIMQDILQVKLATISNLFEFEIRETEGLSIIGENGMGKSKLLSRISNKSKGVGYRGNRGRLSKDEKDLWDLEIDYFDGTLNRAVDERVIDLLERASVKFNSTPVELGRVFDIDQTEFMLKLKQVKGELEKSIALLYCLTKDIKLLLLDDVFGLDDEIKSRLLPFLEKARENYGLTYLIATTDFEMARRLTSFIAVMEDDKIVEYARSETLLKKPLHPYSRWLINSNKKRRDGVVFIRTAKDGKPPKKACKYSLICPFSDDICKSKPCEFVLHGKEHFTACHKL